ncbi:MurR/RpiR family transcriptional regulator [Vibrio vulnificus]|uniref:MurR/RpiR family transcriptional regulator n=1 Tax=Vibrio vulnificus TaxID=672 RepID=UPI0010295BD1|nr:MurR/RpiR family transcriptional regulator [Vibrio vulnificus]EGR0750529.1 MurR/RpiR family transcriptional regulator [Vibrio vulnificus]RZQ32537.1 MurR/RpiR family transcriptional regulator [Vibrio vulnificus]RZQ80818.1 MurR/RpiR family transcriptional regulator [Vibrio vulnificus]
MHESTPLLATLRLIKPGLSPALTQLAEFIEDNLSSVSRMTVTELAEVADVSVSSVSRLSRELGYRNYGDFKMAAHSSISFVPNVNSGAEVDVLDEAEQLFSLTKDLLRDFNFDEFGAYLRRSKGVFVAGENTSLTQLFTDACLNHGKRVVPLTSTAHCEAIKPEVTYKDIFMFISDCPPSAEWLSVLQGLSQSDCVTIAVSPIVPEALGQTYLDYWVPIIGEGSSTFSRINTLLTLEVLTQQLNLDTNVN